MEREGEREGERVIGMYLWVWLCVRVCMCIYRGVPVYIHIETLAISFTNAALQDNLLTAKYIIPLVKRIFI